VHHDDPDVLGKLDQINLFDNPPTGPEAHKTLIAMDCFLLRSAQSQ
jgi:hypothetical protein